MKKYSFLIKERCPECQNNFSVNLHFDSAQKDYKTCSNEKCGYSEDWEFDSVEFDSYTNLKAIADKMIEQGKDTKSYILAISNFSEENPIGKNENRLLLFEKPVFQRVVRNRG